MNRLERAIDSEKINALLSPSLLPCRASYFIKLTRITQTRSNTIDG
jgi:hypothetical protein